MTYRFYFIFSLLVSLKTFASFTTSPPTFEELSEDAEKVKAVIVVLRDTARMSMQDVPYYFKDGRESPISLYIASTIYAAGLLDLIQNYRRKTSGNEICIKLWKSRKDDREEVSATINQKIQSLSKRNHGYRRQIARLDSFLRSINSQVLSVLDGIFDIPNDVGSSSSTSLNLEQLRIQTEYGECIINRKAATYLLSAPYRFRLISDYRFTVTYESLIEATRKEETRHLWQFCECTVLQNLVTLSRILKNKKNFILRSLAHEKIQRLKSDIFDGLLLQITHQGTDAERRAYLIQKLFHISMTCPDLKNDTWLFLHPAFFDTAQEMIEGFFTDLPLESPRKPFSSNRPSTDPDPLADE